VTIVIYQNETKDKINEYLRLLGNVKKITMMEYHIPTNISVNANSVIISPLTNAFEGVEPDAIAEKITHF
jgi:hypothetical protein